MAIKPIPLKHAKKSDREHKVLLGLVELYLQTGRPVGSHTLKEHGFDDLSSATLRNYFARLEEGGYLMQQHSSGGRIPTDLAYKAYAKEHLLESRIDEAIEKQMHTALRIEVKEPAAYLFLATELLSKITGLAAFISAPRFDHDFIIDIKIVGLDHARCLSVVVTQFGLIQTEILYLEKKLSAASIKRIESYCLWRLHGKNEPAPLLDKDEEAQAIAFYHEAIVRYIVGHANFSQMDIFKTGFSKLLTFPEFNDPQTLAGGLALFENREHLAHLLQNAMKNPQISYYIGEDLSPYSSQPHTSAVICMPYLLNQVPVGSIGVLGATRIPYRELFSILKVFAAYVSESLTKSLYKYKLQYRQPNIGRAYLEQEERFFLDRSGPILLEDQRE